MRFEGPKRGTWEQWHENDALVARYKQGKRALLNSMEARISLLYDLLEKRIMPWMWDYDNYYGTDMIGFFYPEDLMAILQIQYLESQRKK